MNHYSLHQTTDCSLSLVIAYNNHTMSWEEASIVAKERNWFRRGISEAICIRRWGGTHQQPRQDLSNVYSPVKVGNARFFAHISLLVKTNSVWMAEFKTPDNSYWSRNLKCCMHPCDYWLIEITCLVWLDPSLFNFQAKRFLVDQET